MSYCIFFFSSRRRHTRFSRDWSSDVCSSDLLARTQNLPPLEWFVVHAVIPSVLLTFALQNHATVQAAPQLPAYAGFVLLPVIEEPWVGGPVPDRFPLLISMPRAEYPGAMTREGLEGYVRLK